MIVLGIETSCDETALALVKDGHQVLTSQVYTQLEEHRPYGGVVPEIASRGHIQKLIPLFEETLNDAQLSTDEIDLIAVTQRPGLMGALLMGITFAKSLAYAINKPLVGVHHIYGHVLASFLDQKDPSFPITGLIASGGHTTLVDIQSLTHIQTLASSIDDAAGEALDKAAKMLGLGFPGGPAIELAALGGNPHQVAFPIALPRKMSFSFSGLKTSLRTYLAQHPDIIAQELKNIAASFQETVMETLVTKLKMAIAHTQSKTALICGGVAANQVLRDKLKALDTEVLLTPKAYCTDNAAMIAAAGFYTYKSKGAFPLDLIAHAHAPNISLQ